MTATAEETRAAARIVLYSTSYCGFCRAAETLLNREAIPFRTVDVTFDRITRRKIQEKTGWPTVPVVLLDDELVGGFQELAALHQRGGLNDLERTADAV